MPIMGRRELTSCDPMPKGACCWDWLETALKKLMEQAKGIINREHIKGTYLFDAFCLQLSVRFFTVF
ncbi:unnamed protein product [Protopolystoma xenopodis]|uniref:Uncharacterized protein n=1 Tax=Protopolystoma xenopodis TaxID=117903 RepID=A0A3S5C4Y6_9PLAT|nr:unnamed protein product [Protopolystoma xenopodis]